MLGDREGERSVQLCLAFLLDEVQQLPRFLRSVLRSGAVCLAVAVCSGVRLLEVVVELDEDLAIDGDLYEEAVWEVQWVGGVCGREFCLPVT